jgi:DNA repair exonuclease SbcCD ATPase subunit
MKIVKLSAHDILRLSAVEITPHGNTIIVSGKNGGGKSSVLNLIWLALDAASAMKTLPTPIRKGASSGEIEVDFGDITVTRAFREGKKPRLEVYSKDGATYPSPQAMLDTLIGRLSFDPLDFAGMKPAEQRRVLLDLLGVELDTFDAKYKEVYDQRTDVNRRVKDLKSQQAGIDRHADAPDEEVSLKDLMDELNKNRAARDRESELRRTAAECNTELERLAQELERVRALHEKTMARWQSASEELNDFPTYRDPDEFVREIEQLDEVNRKVRENATYDELARKVKVASLRADELTGELDKIEQEKSSTLQTAKLPIEGLEVDSDGVLYQGVPFSQASSAEQLRVSLAMAMALNPEVRVIRITDGSLLDEDNMALIEEMAVEHDYQVWIEVVDSTGTLGIYIEDGHVAGEEPAKEKKARKTKPKPAAVAPVCEEPAAEEPAAEEPEEPAPFDLMSQLDFGEE